MATSPGTTPPHDWKNPFTGGLPTNSRFKHEDKTVEFSHVPANSGLPADDSPQTKAELAELQQVQATRTLAQFDGAAVDGKDESVFLFRDVLGDEFTAAKLPVTAALFAKVGNNETAYVDSAKDYWHRQRPFMLDAALHPCGRSKSFSYPSSHATRGYLLGAVLDHLLPQKRDRTLERSAHFARNRLICGVHYPSDIQAGRLVGSALAAVMLSSPSVQKQLADVQTELKSAGYIQ